MTLKTVEQSTYDAWRIGFFGAVFFAVIFFGALVSEAENAQAIRRCLTAGASPDHCLLTVHGR